MGLFCFAVYARVFDWIKKDTKKVETKTKKYSTQLTSVKNSFNNNDYIAIRDIFIPTCFKILFKHS